MSVLAELDKSLQALLQLKAPGVTKSRIAAITTLCVENVKSEATLVQKIYTHFKRAPATHKLGVLYVVDAVTRQWLEKSGSSGQDVAASNPQDGTFAAGVHKITQLLPGMMNDLVANAPYDQKEKIGKLVDIWERGNIFPAEIVTGFKSKLDARRPDASEKQPEPKTSESNPPGSSQSNPSAAATQPLQTGNGASDLLSSLSGLTNMPANSAPTYNQTANGATGYPQSSAPPNPSAAPQMVQQAAAASNPDQLNQLSSVIPPHIANDPAALQQHLQLLQQLVQLGVPPDQWMTVIEAMKGQNAQQSGMGQMQSQPQSSAPMQPQQQPQQSYNSPARNKSRSPPRRRGSPTYGEYQSNNSYRQRSQDRSNTPSMGNDMIPLGEPKWTTFDPSLPDGTIRVLSRTLFVGGTTCGEPELCQIFGTYGQVQTCIPNPDKRHAFVKFTNRAGAETAREALINIQDPNLQQVLRSVRWGVGFGPRDCNDYQSGVSVIPIDRLTDADRKWVLTAPHGGSGGKPIESGLVMEEPDIEIGAGVSSKAISRRVGGQDTFRRGGGNQGGGRGSDGGFRGGRGGGGGGGGNQGYGQQRRSSPNRQQPAVMPPQRYEPGMPPMNMQGGYGMPPQPQGFYGMPPNYG